MKPSPKFLFVSAITLSIILSGIVGFYILGKAMKRPKLPVIGQIRPFELVNQQGEQFDSEKLYQNVWIVSFFSTPCLDNCRKMMNNMASLSRTFDQVRAVRLVSISVSPEQDGVAALDKFSKEFSKGKNNWHFLTGDPQTVSGLHKDQLKVSLDMERGQFSPTLALIDRSGYIRRYYDGVAMADVNELFLDASALLKERF